MRPLGRYLFVEKSLLFMRKKGTLSFITPNAWLSNKYAKGLRRVVLKKSNLERLINLNKQFVFENAGVETCIFQISKKEPVSEIIVGNDISIESQYIYKKDLWQNQENNIIAFSENTNVGLIWEIILSAKMKIDDVLDISNGFKPYQVGYGLNREGVPLNNDDVSNKIYHSKIKEDDTYVPQLKGKNVKKYSLDWTEGYISWGKWLMSPKDIKYYINKKILIRQIISNTLICAIDEENYFADQTLYIGIEKPNTNISIEYCTGYLNSKVLGFFFRTYYSEDDDLFPKIKVNELKNLPIKVGNENFNSIISLLVILMQFYAKKQQNFTFIEKIVDALFFELFFFDHMREKEIDVMQFVEQDLQVALQERNFEQLDDVQKSEIIESLHKIWTHPDNEVRNRIKLFAVRSPEILKPILES